MHTVLGALSFTPQRTILFAFQSFQEFLRRVRYNPECSGCISNDPTVMTHRCREISSKYGSINAVIAKYKMFRWTRKTSWDRFPLHAVFSD